MVKKKNRAYFQKKIIDHLCAELGYTEQEKNLMLLLESDDLFGDWIKNNTKFNSYTQDNAWNFFLKIKEGAEKVNMELFDYYRLKKIFYLVDAGSYTEDAGGKKSLDHLFIFDQKNNKLSLNNNVEHNLSAYLENRLTKYSNIKKYQTHIENRDLYNKISEETELIKIKPEDKNDKGELLAPNQKPSNLPEREWKMVRTEAFKNWFGDWTKYDKENFQQWINLQTLKEIDQMLDDQYEQDEAKRKAFYGIREASRKEINYLDSSIKNTEEWFKYSQETSLKTILNLRQIKSNLQAELVNKNYNPFKDDFSKAVDENGEPMLMWRAASHGPNEKGLFEIPIRQIVEGEPKFSLPTQENQDQNNPRVGVFLGQKEEATFQYKNQFYMGDMPHLYSCFCNTRNYVMLDEKFMWHNNKKKLNKIKRDYDGILVKKYDRSYQSGRRGGMMNFLDFVCFDNKNVLITKVEG